MSQGVATLYIHAGVEPDPTTGAIMTPIYQTSTYAQAAPGVNKGYEYSRSGNPTRTALEKALAAIEFGSHGLAFASGLAAENAIMSLLRPGDEVIAGSDMYGGTYRLFTQIWEQYGLSFRFVDMTDLSNIEKALTNKTRMIWTETPTNPLLNVTDIAGVSAIAQTHGVLLCVDNTFASPYLQNPLKLGADIVVHSATKYLGGHSDVVLGGLVVKDPQLYERLRFYQNAAGAVPGPQDCFLVLRGIKTLHLRMQRHCENGVAIAHFLRNHSKVAKVHWCGFEDHPGYAIARRQMRDFGGMLSFELKNDSTEEVKRVLAGTRIIALAESLGGVESLMNHPATMTHASIPREERIKNGLTDGLIRLSIGIEDAADLMADLDQALA